MTIKEDDTAPAFAKSAMVLSEEDEGMDDVVLAQAEMVSGLHIEQAAAIQKGEEQPNEYRDFPFAVLFGLHCIAVIGISWHYTPFVFSQYVDVDITEDDVTAPAEDTDGDGSSLLLLLLSCYASAGLSVFIALKLMMKYSEIMVKLSFFVAPLSFIVIAIVFAALGSDMSFIFCSIAILFSFMMICCYYCYKRFIPFAAANLNTALSCLECYPSTYFLAFLFSVVSAVTMSIWGLALAGVQAKADSLGKVACQDIAGLDDDIVYPNGSQCDLHPPNPVLMMFLILAFYWTQQVVQNVMHVTTAGIVGEWWFQPLSQGGGSCCNNPTVAGSVYRATTYSFGSICLGSLLVAIMQLLEHMARRARNSRRSIITCVIQCIVACLRDLLEYFNSWAFVYVGLYGYKYIDAGRNVITLFKQKGWTSLIADRLVYRVLLFCNIGVGALSGTTSALFGLILKHDAGAAFWIGFLGGFVLASVVLFCVESAVRTVIVCWAESPAEFEESHPELSEKLQAGFMETYGNTVVATAVTGEVV